MFHLRKFCRLFFYFMYTYIKYLIKNYNFELHVIFVTNHIDERIFLSCTNIDQEKYRCVISKSGRNDRWKSMCGNNGFCNWIL